MKISKTTIGQIRQVEIVDVARKLDIEMTCRNGVYHFVCPAHDDHDPSAEIAPKYNQWHCWSCGARGDGIDLVMKKLSIKYIDAVRWIAEKFNIEVREEERGGNWKPYKPKDMKKKDYIDSGWLGRCQKREAPFCTYLASNRILSQEQVRHAVSQYHLGATRDDGVVFWLIDQTGKVRDGKIMFYQPDCHRDKERHPSWVSARLKAQNALDAKWESEKCLFGEHLLRGKTGEQTVAIVESEKTAIILSELRPGVIWLASGGESSLTDEKLYAVATGGEARKLILFPDTDTDGATYRKWRETADRVSKKTGRDIMVSDILERMATDGQKVRKIDIADLLIE